MSKPTLQAMVAKRLQYVDLMSQCGGQPGTQKHTQLLADCVQGILQAARQVKALTPDACLEIKALLEPKLPADMVTTVMTALDVKVF